MNIADFYIPAIPFAPISPRWDVNEHYYTCRKQGCSHRLAEMLACQSAPALDTPTTFINGINDNMQDEDDPYAKYAVQRAREAGVNIRGARYCHQLATEMGDPKAWITSKDDVKKIAERNGQNVSGWGLNYQAPDYEVPEPKKQYMVAPDIVESEFHKLPADIQHQPHAKDDLRERLSGR